MTGIAEGLAGSREVCVICGQPQYAERGTVAPKRERRNGVSILRRGSASLRGSGVFSRLVNNVTISVAMTYSLLKMGRRGDVAVTLTNPPMLPLMVYLACWIRGVRMVLIVHDVYPDAMVAAGLIKQGSLTRRMLSLLNSFVLNRADKIVAIGRDMERLIAGRLKRRNLDRLQLIPNWADLDLVDACGRDDAKLLKELGLDRKFVVQYAGNMGRTHDIDCLLRCAKSMRGNSYIHFLVVSSGSGVARFKTMLDEMGLDNVTVMDRCARDRLSDLLNSCDVALIPLKDGMKGVSVPSRIYNILAAGKPILAVASSGSELDLMIEEGNLGWVVHRNDPELLRLAVMAAYDKRGEFASFRSRAREWVAQRYSYERAIDAYQELFDGLQGPLVAPGLDGAVGSSTGMRNE